MDPATVRMVERVCRSFAHCDRRGDCRCVKCVAEQEAVARDILIETEVDYRFDRIGLDGLSEFVPVSSNESFPRRLCLGPKAVEGGFGNVRFGRAFMHGHDEGTPTTHSSDSAYRRSLVTAGAPMVAVKASAQDAYNVRCMFVEYVIGRFIPFTDAADLQMRICRPLAPPITVTRTCVGGVNIDQECALVFQRYTCDMHTILFKTCAYFGDADAVFVVAALAERLVHLQSSVEFMHRDMKVDNIFIDRDPVACTRRVGDAVFHNIAVTPYIADLGAARVVLNGVPVFADVANDATTPLNKGYDMCFFLASILASGGVERDFPTLHRIAFDVCSQFPDVMTAIEESADIASPVTSLTCSDSEFSDSLVLEGEGEVEGGGPECPATVSPTVSRARTPIADLYDSSSATLSSCTNSTASNCWAPVHTVCSRASDRDAFFPESVLARITEMFRTYKDGGAADLAEVFSPSRLSDVLASTDAVAGGGT